MVLKLKYDSETWFCILDQLLEVETHAVFRYVTFSPEC